MHKDYHFTLATKHTTLRDYPKGVIVVPRANVYFELPRSMGKSVGIPTSPKCKVIEENIADAIEAIENGMSVIVLNDNGVIAGILTKDEPVNLSTFGSFTWTPDIMRDLALNPEKDVETTTRQEFVTFPILAVDPKSDGEYYQSGNGNVYPKAVLEKALKDWEVKGKVPITYGGVMVGEVSHDGKVFITSDNIKMAIDSGATDSFSIRATVKNGKIVDVTGWNLVDATEEEVYRRDFSNEWTAGTEVDPTKAELARESREAYAETAGDMVKTILEPVTGIDVDNFAKKFLTVIERNKDIENFKADNLLLIDRHGALIGYVDRDTYQQRELGRGLTHPSMQCKYGEHTIGCHGGKAFLDHEHILPEVKGVIGITRHSSGVLAWIVNPKIMMSSLSGANASDCVRDVERHKEFMTQLNLSIQDYLNRIS